MNWRDAALGLAGVVGSGIAVAHGILTQQLMVRPSREAFVADKEIQQLVALQLHLSTVSWFLGGLALIAAIWFEQKVRFATGIFVGSLYLYGAFGAVWVTRGRHPAPLLMGAVLLLIAFGASKPNA
ncbi:MAG TPA: hypothetical protein VEY30_09800 [Myxococcaceae bacterium]|nr:hypothetical protein [Myxococcaceae bacterium]